MCELLQEFEATVSGGILKSCSLMLLGDLATDCKSHRGLNEICAMLEGDILHRESTG